MSVASSRVSLDGDDKEAHVTGVQGEMFQQGKPVSQFSAPNGKVQSESKHMVLWGGVTLTSIERGITLKTDRLTWDEAKSVYVARGNVWIETKDWRNGPMPEIWAEPDLEKFGSPEYFK